MKLKKVLIGIIAGLLITLPLYAASISTGSRSESDPQVGDVTNGNHCVGDGSAVQCTDSSTYLTTETDPVVGAITGLIKADGGGNISAATAGSDYVAAETDPEVGDVTTSGNFCKADGDSVECTDSNTYLTSQNWERVPITSYTFVAGYGSSIDADSGGGVLTGTAVGGASVASGKLDLAYNDVRYVDYAADNNADSQQVGTIKFKYTPNYSGAPTYEMCMFTIEKADQDPTNRIHLCHLAAGEFGAKLYLNISGVIDAYMSEWYPVSGTTYQFEVHYDITTGNTYIKIDNVLFDAVMTATGTRTADIGLLRIGGNWDSSSPDYSNFKIDDFTVDAGGVSYTKLVPSTLTDKVELQEIASYVSHPSLSADTQLADKKYVDDTVAGFTEVDPTVDTSAEIQAIIGASVYEPYGFTETDPKVGTLTNTKWCTSDGTQVICNTNAPLGSGDVVAPVTNTDNYVPQWNGADSKTLKDGLSTDGSGDCSSGAICLGDHTHSGYLSSEVDPTVDTSAEIQAIIGSGVYAPDAAYLTSETDPQVGTLTNTKWCTSDGSAVNCSSNAPVTSEVDPTVDSSAEIQAIIGASVYEPYGVVLDDIAGGTAPASAFDFGGATSVEIPNGTSPTVDAAGEIAVDTTDGQLIYYGTAKRVIAYEQTKCRVINNVAAADDDMPLGMFNDPVTVTGVGVHCAGTCTTAATIALEDRSGNAMTHSAPTVSTGTGNTTFTAVTAANGLVAGEGLRFDVTNTPSPSTDTYTVCYTFTSDAQ